VQAAMQMSIVMEEHYTRCQLSMPFVLDGPLMLFFFSVLQYKMWLCSQVADFFDTGI
jgi:hypothetical protein